MLISEEEQFHIDNEFGPYALTKEERNIKIATSILKKIYPDCIIPQDENSIHILDRTMAYMLHLDKQFDLNKTFDMEHYQKMVTEAKIYTEWLDSENIPWPPEGLKYSIAIENVEENDVVSVEDISDSSIESNDKKPHAKVKTSRYQKGKQYFLEDIQAGYAREYTLKRMMQDFNLSHATSNVYYSKYKSEYNLI